MYEQKEIDALQAAIAALKHAHKAVNWQALPVQHTIDEMTENLYQGMSGLLQLNAEYESIK